jgi:Family of unknown function (DUF5994)
VTAPEYIVPLNKPATSSASSAQTPVGADGLRLRRREPSAADGFVDGGWWPHTLDLSLELPRLLAAFRPPGQHVARVVYNPAAWDPAPRTLTVSGHVVRLDRSSGREPALLSLVDASGGTRADLIVVPPRTDRRVAERVLALTQSGGDLRRIVGMLERAERRPTARLGRTTPGDLLPAAV